jgi:DNA modification methylase
VAALRRSWREAVGPVIAEQLAPLAVSIERLAPLPGNPRRGDVEAVARSLAMFGQRKPIVATRDGTVIAGNHTLAGALQLGWAEIAVVWVDDDAATAKAFALADNRTHDLGTYDEAALAALVAEVAGFENAALFAATGYDEASLAALVAAAMPAPPPPETFTDPDDVPETAPAITGAGDVWRLGAHRLVCGDSRDPATIAALMGDERATCCWTDPPYGVGVVGGSRALTVEERVALGGQSIANDTLDPSDLAAFLGAVFANTDAVLSPGARIYVAHPSVPALAAVFVAAVAGRWKLRQSLVWVKQSLVLGHADYHYRHEPILFAYKDAPGRWGRGGLGWYGDHAQTSVFEIDKPNANRIHPTMKPVELVARMVTNSSAVDDVVIDPFGGSGTTLIACHQLHRRARLVELDPHYVDVICRRWQEHTGAAPLRDGVPHNFAIEAA